MTKINPRRKMLYSTLMLLLVCLLWSFGLKPWSGWALGAIVASWMADALLAKYPPFLQRLKGSFFIGAVLFALAHGAYAAASIMILRAMGLPFRWLNFSLVMLVFTLLVVIHALYFRRSSQRKKGFTVAATSYLLVVGAMAALTFRVFAQSGGRLWPLSLGACLFFLSDCILVVREYRRAKNLTMNRVIWITYVAGQLLLQLGLWLA